MSADTIESTFSHPCKDTCSVWKQGYNEGKVSVDVRSKEVLLAEITELRKENEKYKKRLDWMLHHGARVYNYQEYTGYRNGNGYYCSYHPHKGPSDTPLGALDLAIEYDEKSKKK